MEGSDFREAGKHTDRKDGPRASASEAPNEMPRIGYRERETVLQKGNNRTRREHGLKVSKQSWAEGGTAMYGSGMQR
jgi:hypothetical protein